MKRSKFSLSHYHLTTMTMGNLVPVGLVEVLPGDTIQHATSALVRCAPLVSPPMHPVHVRIHHWFVPHRIVWEDWEDFITGGPDGMDASDFPTKTLDDEEGLSSLSNYLGVPDTGSVGGGGLEVSALPYRGYALIYNEWYRDQDLVSPLTIDLTSGPDTTTNKTLQPCAWEKDYFTTSRPWEVKGPQITLPLGTSAPVVSPTGAANPNIIRKAGDGTINATNANLVNAVTTGHLAISGISDAYLDPNGSLSADLSAATAVSINVLREALALQRFEEARARYGSRYTEYLRYLGVKSSDARLQRPEYLGGGKQTLQFSEVLSTNFTPDTLTPGQFGGHGITAMRSNRYRRFFEEHGYVFSLMSVVPKTIYTNGLARTWNRRTKEDFFQRELQHIGQQIVRLKEVDANVAAGEGAGQQDFIFGYQDRYDEYRRCESRISGDFAASTLDTWHFGRNFGSAPTLNNDFVNCDPSVLPFADQAAPTLYVMANHNIQARRLLAPRGNSLTF